MASIIFNGNTIQNPSSSQDAQNTNYIYIQCGGILSDENMDQLEQLRVVIQEYMGNNTYLCRYEPADLDSIRSLPFIVMANVYHKSRISPDLSNSPEYLSYNGSEHDVLKIRHEC